MWENISKKIVKFFLNVQVLNKAAQGELFFQKQLKHMGVYQEHESRSIKKLVDRHLLEISTGFEIERKFGTICQNNFFKSQITDKLFIIL